MNKLKRLFKEKKNNILSIYFTAGYPVLDSALKILPALEKAGVDFVEAGMPFSDPMADGPVIQQSSEKALKNGMNLDIYFSQLEYLKDKINIPVVAMGYVNQMMRYGEERFLQRCKDAGISALILPDLPLKIYLNDYKILFEKYGLTNIFLITPQTSEERIREIDNASDTFIYMVSSSSTTGTKEKISAEQKSYFERIKNLKLKNPTVIGFGISNHETFSNACNYAAGAIIGSAFVKTVSEDSSEESIINFVRKIKEGE